MIFNDFSPQRVNDPNDVRICVFDGVSASGVYVGFLDSLRLITTELKWRTDDQSSEMLLVSFKELTLKEISDQVNKRYHDSATIIVITYGPLKGEIYEYGNHGGYWEQVGVLAGYA